MSFGSCSGGTAAFCIFSRFFVFCHSKDEKKVYTEGNQKNEPPFCLAGGVNMSLFGFLKRADINAGVEEFRRTSGAVLLDVRTIQEYRDGHIPGSKNVPLQSLEKIEDEVKDLTSPVFVYCYSGGRIRQAVAILERMGYTNVKNIGGIADWKGEMKRG
jgi:rhodanese-related sulfurtransferase